MCVLGSMLAVHIDSLYEATVCNSHGPDTLLASVSIFLTTVINEIGTGTGGMLTCSCGIDVIWSNAITNGALTNNFDLYLTHRHDMFDSTLLAGMT